MLDPVKSIVNAPKNFNFDEEPSLAVEVIQALQKTQVQLCPKFLYNRLGSQLFEAICELPEYYPTRTEDSIIQTNLSEIKNTIGQGSTMIDLGAGNCAKAAKLFDHLKPKLYVPVDVSSEFLIDSCESLKLRFPEITIIPLAQDFSKRLVIPDGLNKKLFFYPGSSIGNFTPEEALDFLKQIYRCCDSDSGILLGVDLIKNKKALEDAYDDALGVTAAFNLNILNHLNRIAGTNFQLSDWHHRAVFNSQENRVEMHLVANSDVTVTWNGGGRTFNKGEYIHTESSHKYSETEFTKLLLSAGFKTVRCWTDPQNWFLVTYASAGGVSYDGR